MILEFPDRKAARSWYHSPAYQELVPLRTRHIDGDLIIVGGVAPDHDSAAFAARLRADAAA